MILIKFHFFIYGTGIVFWFSHPTAVFFNKHCHLSQKIGLLGVQWTVLFVCCLISIVCLFFILKYCQKFVKNFNKIASTFIFILSVLLLVNCVQKIFSEANIGSKSSANSNHVDKQQYPNVYHILLDAHPNREGMKIIGGDLKPFYNELESLGFVTFPESRSNYPATIWSVSSMLNMKYLGDDWEMQPDSKWRKMINNNEVFKHFQDKGYEVLSACDNRMLESFYLTTKKLMVDRQYSNIPMVLYCFLMGTPIKHVFEKIFPQVFAQSVRNGLENVFDSLKLGKNFYGNTSNVFYAHLCCPHEPCVFGKQAKNMAFSGFTIKFDVFNFLKPEVHKAYCENIYGIDQLALKFIKEILNQYKTESIKPIIILHSDHSILYNGRNLKSPFITPDTVYGNLLALYIPDEWKQDAKDLKFINLYRWIFNHLFGDNFQYFNKNQQM